MRFSPYTYAGAHIAAWLVNNPSPGAPDLAAVLEGYDVHQPTATTAQVRALRPWAQRLRGLFEAGDVAEKAERADALLIAADCRPRYLGLDKTRLEHLAAATAVNVVRLDAWYAGKPLDRTRTTHLQRIDLTPCPWPGSPVRRRPRVS